MHKFRFLVLSITLLMTGAAVAFEPFTVRRIEVEGLQRITKGTVLNYLPVTEGERMSNSRAREAVRSLYKTGFFRNVQLDRKGNTLVLKVSERPAIAEIEFEGNKKIKTEQLEDGLRQSGLERNALFKQSLLTQMTQELRRQYYSNGFYGVKIEPLVAKRDKNQVALKIVVDEGRIAKIREINIVGNQIFTDKELLELFELRTPTWDSWYTKKDQYSQFKLSGDLEKLGSFYQDRGYLRFDINSVQVSLSEDKRDVYITVNISEGEQYTVSKVDVAGDYVLTEADVRRLISLQAGDVFSRGQLTASSDAISGRLGIDGYAFTNVNAIPKIDDDLKKVGLTFFIEPGKRTYVRRITIRGNLKTDDEVFRRELRVFEGGLYTSALLERSRERIARLPYVENVKFETAQVPGSPDQIDIVFEVAERAPGSIQFGVGFSGSSGFLINGNVTHSNFLGTGNRISLDATRNEISTALSFSFTQPYYTVDGVSRTLGATYRRSDAANIDSSSFITNVLGTSLSYGFPLSEYARFNAGLQYRNTELFTSPFTSDEVNTFAVRHGSNFDTYKARFSLSRDTRNRGIFANRGSLHRLGVDVTLPGSDLDYYTADYRWLQYVPMFAGFILELDTEIGYVEEFGDSFNPPPFERLFGGGTESVRGYRDGSLGPRDTPNNRNYGGTFKVNSQFELILPGFLKSDGVSTRFVAFADVGNVYNNVEDFNEDGVRASAGVGFYWLTPILGIMKFSYATPINDKPGDRIDRFQFTFGVPF